MSIDFNIDAVFREAYEKMGVANILIAGKTGVGKSTLINAVFQNDFAETAQGRPVTQETKRWTKEGVPIAIYDTRGLEVKDYKKTIESLESHIISCKNANHKEHIHAAWVCISEDSRRVEDAEIDLINMLDKNGIPVIVVITKSRQDNGFHAKVKELLINARQVVRVRAISEEFDDGHITMPFGLDKLIAITMEVLPDGQRNAFVAAQKISLAAKKSRAQSATHAAAGLAGLAAAVPIPFSDAAALAPIQVGMLTSISYIYDCSFSDGFFKTMLAAVVGVGGAALAGRAIVANILKFIPVIGSGVGGTISAITATTLTEIIGHAYIAALESLIGNNGSLKNVSPQQIAEAFKNELKK